MNSQSAPNPVESFNFVRHALMVSVTPVPNSELIGVYRHLDIVADFINSVMRERETSPSPEPKPTEHKKPGPKPKSAPNPADLGSEDVPPCPT